MVGCGTCLFEWVDLSQIARRKGAQRSELCVAEHASVFNAGNV